MLPQTVTPHKLRTVSRYFVIGLLLSVVGVILFARLAEDVVNKEWLTEFDLALANVLHAEAQLTLITFFRLVTTFGSAWVFIPLSVLVAFIYVRWRQWLYLIIWLVAYMGGELLNALLKAWFARPRPVFTDPFALEPSFSFPSGHAMVSLIAYGMLAYFISIRLQNRIARILVIFTASLLIVLIGISRMYLGVHYFSDVVAGYAAGGVWLSACITAAEFIHRRSRQSPVSLD